MGRGKSLAQGFLRSAGLELGLFYLYSRQPLSQSHRVRAITSTWCSLLSHSWWGPLMNVRGGSTILRTLGVPKNYSIFIWYKSTSFTLFLSPFTGQHQRLNLSLPVSFLSSSSHLLSSSTSYHLLLIVITIGNYVIGLGFLQPREKGGSTWRYLYQALGQFSLKKRHEFFSLRFYVFFVFWFQARFLGVSLN